MTTTAPIFGQSSLKMIIVVTLLAAVFASAIIDSVLPINILDIAATFGILPGTVAQLGSLMALASVITALFLGAFSTRFRYKSLVMIGLLFIAACDIGLFLAPTFPIASFSILLNGIGSVMIIVTAQTFIGNSYPLDKKAKAIGWVAAAGSLANAVGAPIIGFMTGIGGWRSSLVWFMLPTAIVSLIFVFLVFPYNPPELQTGIKKEPFMKGYKQVLTNKSAAACLATTFLGSASWIGGAVFLVTFLRQVFLTPPGLAALVGMFAGTAFITTGAIIGGHIVNRVGRKRLTVVGVFLAGLLVLLSYSVPVLSIFLALRWLASAFVGMLLAAGSNLMLEQVPQFRGTAMSLNSAFSGIGSAIGIVVAGTILNLYTNSPIGFQMLGLIVGAFAFTASLINLFFAKDPIRNQQLTRKVAT